MMTTEERLTRLERKNRRLTLALVLTGLAAALAVTAGMGPAGTVPDEVKAHRFTLVDADGKTRARLGPSSEGASFILFDASGKGRAGFGMTKQGPEILMTDEKGKPQVKLAAEGRPAARIVRRERQVAGRSDGDQGRRRRRPRLSTVRRVRSCAGRADGEQGRPLLRPVEPQRRGVEELAVRRRDRTS